MICRIFSCIITYHGSLKYVILPVRFKGFKSGKPVAKILAASSLPASSVRSNTYDDLQTEQPSKVKSVISNEECLSVNDVKRPTVSNNNITTEEVSNKIQNELSNPVTKLDVTIVVNNLNEKEDETAKTVKLLHSIKPSDLEWHKQVINLRFLPNYYKSLSKFRLTGLVVLTTLAGYGMAPGPLEPVTLFCMMLGTALTSAAANSINQILEVPYDSQMSRTKNRVLIRGLITPLHASLFAAFSATVGLSTLYFGTNALTASLGAINLILYTSIYTPLKRCSIANTWLGSIVGAIPPLMGWAACTGTLNSGAFLMGAILYAWQFPHFNALSWNLRPDYSKAGYRMTSVVDPALCRRAALRHSILMLFLCSSAPVLDLTTWTFAFDSFPLNCYLIYCTWQFYRNADSQSSRKLFRLSLIHLPLLMFLMFLGKKYSDNTDKSIKQDYNDL